MSDNNDNDSHPEDESSVVLHTGAFDAPRKRVHAHRQNEAARRMSVRKRLVLRILNKDRKHPHLRIIK